MDFPVQAAPSRARLSRPRGLGDVGFLSCSCQNLIHEFREHHERSKFSHRDLKMKLHSIIAIFCLYACSCLSLWAFEIDPPKVPNPLNVSEYRALRDHLLEEYKLKTTPQHEIEDLRALYRIAWLERQKTLYNEGKADARYTSARDMHERIKISRVGDSPAAEAAQAEKNHKEEAAAEKQTRSNEDRGNAYNTRMGILGKNLQNAAMRWTKVPDNDVAAKEMALAEVREANELQNDEINYFTIGSQIGPEAEALVRSSNLRIRFISGVIVSRIKDNTYEIASGFEDNVWNFDNKKEKHYILHTTKTEFQSTGSFTMSVVVSPDKLKAKTNNGFMTEYGILREWVVPEKR
jgi:hypothetical protein